MEYTVTVYPHYKGSQPVTFTKDNLKAALHMAAQHYMLSKHHSTMTDEQGNLVALDGKLVNPELHEETLSKETENAF